MTPATRNQLCQDCIDYDTDKNWCNWGCYGFDIIMKNGYFILEFMENASRAIEDANDNDMIPTITKCIHKRVEKITGDKHVIL